ncbi:hypothetical protein BD289DRAFT_50768 [Coniella lustricola]|uniref:NADH-ubiquinone reductase complex 1 MLRQ subunit-domain-containing protein n=1 Tax=Coniella lustricola TaxID=2025994 RepID=A0A2T3A1A7_9PEZI|nr:hypothetical protein BD289DRAFT_50768 [Coniella lustricola]
MFPTRSLLGPATNGNPNSRTPPPRPQTQGNFLSRNLASLKKIPPELMPLFAIVGVALTFGSGTMLHKLWTNEDHDMRLNYQNTQPPSVVRDQAEKVKREGN